MYSLIEGLGLTAIIMGTIFAVVRIIVRHEAIRTGNHPWSRRVQAARDEMKVAELTAKTAEHLHTKELLDLKHQALLDLIQTEDGKRELLALPSGKDQEESVYHPGRSNAY